MNYLDLWGDIIITSLNNLWVSVIDFTPRLLGGLIILIGGLIIASILGKLAKRLMDYVKIDSLAGKLGVMQEFERMGMQFTFAGLISWAVRWFFIIATLIAVIDVLQIPQVTGFLEAIAMYIPNVIVAIIILAIGFVAANFVYNVVERALAASKIAATAARGLGSIARWAIIIFAFMAALVQLGIAAQLIQILFTGLVAMLALAGGLAFGLGGKERAARWLDKIAGEISHR